MNSIKLLVDGEEVGTLSGIGESTVIQEQGTTNFAPLPSVAVKSEPLTLRSIKVRPTFLEGLGLTAEGFDVIVKSVERNPNARPLRSKKKRLRKKWEKRNTRVLIERAYRNCFIQDIEER